MSDQQDRIEEKIDRLTSIVLAMVPTAKLPAKLRRLPSDAKTPEDLLELRRKEMMRIFHSAGRDLPRETKERQKYPLPITLERMEAVPHRILITRASLNRVFAPVVNCMEIRSIDNAEACLESLLDSGALIKSKLCETKIEQIGHRNSNATVVFSQKEYNRIQGIKEPVVMPVRTFGKNEENFEEAIKTDPWVPPAKDPQNIWVPLKKAEVVEKYEEPQCDDCGEPGIRGLCENCDPNTLPPKEPAIFIK